MNVLDLFSGIGGFALGLESVGMRTVGFCEIEPFPRTVLAHHWPDVPIHDDVRTLSAESVCGPTSGLCPGPPPVSEEMAQATPPAPDATPCEYSHGRPFVACRCGCGQDVPPPKPASRHARLYASDACRARVRNRKLAAALAEVEARQRPLPLDPAPEPLIQPRDQRVRARRRAFSAQAKRILARLEAGPVANVELALMFPPATAWRSRLSDVRWELRRRLGLVKDKDPDPIPGYDCGGGIVWHWIGEA